MDANPYAAPLATGTPPPPLLGSDADMIRREHIKHEASVKSIGTLYLLGFVFFLLGTIGQLFSAAFGEAGASRGEAWGLAALFAVLTVLYFWMGRGLRRLDRSTRAVAAVFAAIGLLGFPLGTLISGYILYLLMSQKGAMVFSPQYKEIIAATPHVRYKTSLAVWIILGIVVLLIVGGVAAIIFASMSRH